MPGKLLQGEGSWLRVVALRVLRAAGQGRCIKGIDERAA